MKYYFKKLTVFLYICLAFIAYSCSQEKDYVKEQKQLYRKTIKSNYLNKNETENIIKLINKKISYAKGLNVLSKNSLYMRTSSGTIDYNQILEVTDTLGVKNYTFRVLNHPNADLKTYYNFIVNVKDSTTVSFHLFEYKMSDNFFQDLQEGIKKITEFKGTITHTNLDQVNPCETIIPINTNPIIIPGGSQISIPINTSPPNTTDPQGGGGTDVPVFSNTGDNCWGYLIAYCCENIHHGEYDGCHCKKNGQFIGATFLVNTCTGFTVQLHRSTEDPCFPDGEIGVLNDDSTIKVPCEKLGNLLSQIKNNIVGLKNTLDQPGENGVLFNKDDTGQTENSIIPASYGRLLSIKLKQNSYGYVHTHPFSAYPMLSWGDVYTIYQIYQNSQYFNREDITVMLIAKSDDGLTDLVYAVTIQNPDLFIGLINQAINQEEFIGCSNFEKINILSFNLAKRFENESSNYESDFLREFYGSGLNLWKANPNLTSWSKLSLNNLTMSTTETPCNN